MGNTGIKRQKSPNNLINADHYHGGKSKFIGFAKVPAVIKLIADYPWQVIKTLGSKNKTMMKSIGIIGEYYSSFRPHTALNESLGHVRDMYEYEFNYEWIETTRVEEEGEKILNKFAGIWSAPGSPFKSLHGALKAINYARTNNLPHLGTCAGFQHVVVEFARNVLGFTNAQHEEYGPSSEQLFINRLACSLAGEKMKVNIRPNTLAARCYGENKTEENYYCNFGINPEFQKNLDHPDLLISGVDNDGEIRIIELPQNKFFLATLFVPQVNSKPSSPHPIIKSFVESCLE